MRGRKSNADASVIRPGWIRERSRIMEAEDKQFGLVSNTDSYRL